jgi:ribosomal protein L11 methyltransferase
LNFFEVKIKTSADGIDPVCGRLLCLGVTGFEIKNPNDFNEFLENKTGNWDYIDDELLSLRSGDTEVICYLADNNQGLDSLAEIIETIGELKALDTENKFGELTVISDKVREEDWADNWKQYFKPFAVGKTLLIKPSWEKAPKTKRKIIEIDPGSSFGTGQHASTKLCLELFERYRDKDGNDTVLDLGTGSGILSAAAAVLGVSYIKAVDIDENAVKIAAENIAKNNINTPFDTACGNVLTDKTFNKSLTDRKYSVIFANIVADVLIAMSPLIYKYLEKNGIIIMSGIISERADEVINAMTAKGYVLKEKAEENDWAALVFAEEKE